MGQANSTSKGPTIRSSRPKTLVVFGDSMSDGGLHGYGVGNAETWRTGNYPPMAIATPQGEMRKRFGSTYPFPELGYYDHTFSDGLTWPHHLGIPTVHNFAHGSATTCQAAMPGEKTPEGFRALSSNTGMSRMSETTVLPRGAIQQVEMAEAFLPKELWHDPSVLVVVAIGTNDFFYHGKDAIGHTKEEAKDSTTVRNYRKLVERIRRLGVADTNLVVACLTAGDTMPGFRSGLCQCGDMAWFRGQIEAVNDAIAAIGPAYWKGFEDTARWLGLQEKASDFKIYDRLPNMSSAEDLVPMGCSSDEVGWFDEYHPNVQTHKMIAKSLASQFFCA
mmetsp:Transcript_8391/g.15305  ORF Transcript_8391/g.15305 Transcript_8391/m.15305 type:complete len:333 (+) Transcript_8391:86-1084(+)